MNEIVNKSTIYNGKIITVEKKQLKLPNGVIVDREFVDHKPAATMLAIIDNAVVLVSQYRIGSNSQLLELPAGLMENGENRSTYGDVASHYNNIFNTSQAAKDYRYNVYNEFLNTMYQ